MECTEQLLMLNSIEVASIVTLFSYMITSTLLRIIPIRFHESLMSSHLKIDY